MKLCCVYFNDLDDNIQLFSKNSITDGTSNTELDTVPTK